MTGKEAVAATFEEAAILFAHDFELEGGELGPNGRKVLLRFRDPRGEGAKLLQEHSRRGVMVNSLRFQEGLSRAKSAIFAVRDRRF